MPFTLSIALALATALGGSPASVATLQQMPQAGSVKEYVQTYFVDVPVMVSIAECESHFRQIGEDKQVLEVTNTNGTYDIGIMQINSIHITDAAKLGFDINNLQDNLAYGKYLYDKQGTAPWNSSKACWKNSDAAKAAAADQSLALATK